MSQIDTTALMRNALREIERLQRELDGAEQRRHAPIAVVGMGCRFAGVDSPEALWQRLLDGADGVSEVPAERWDVERYFDADPDASGRIYCRTGSFGRHRLLRRRLLRHFGARGGDAGSAAAHAA